MVMVMVMTMIMEGTQKQKGKEKGRKRKKRSKKTEYEICKASIYEPHLIMTRTTRTMPQTTNAFKKTPSKPNTDQKDKKMGARAEVGWSVGGYEEIM